MLSLRIYIAIVCVLYACITVQGQTTDSSTSDVPVGTECTAPRIRKSWDYYTQQEKTTYLEALALAMQQGYHQKFVELHTEYFSEGEAHGNCMFMYWHRMFLLGYENMLRSRGTKYQCVTLPYWDHLYATAKRSAGKCSTMHDCSQIYMDLGGGSIGSYKSLRIYNVTIPSRAGLCVSNGVLRNFCGNTTTCARCIIRGRPLSYPAEAYFGSVLQQVFRYTSWPNFAYSVERGVHNMVHSKIGGIMAYFQSPIDPVFYTHHAFIDNLQTIYLKCGLRSATATLTLAQKGSDSRVWSNCARRHRPPNYFQGTNEIYMACRDYDGVWGNVRNGRNILYPFFKDLPKTYAEYVDAKDMGVYSYTYEQVGSLQNMFNHCAAATHVSAALLAEEEQDRNGRPQQIQDDPEESNYRRWTIAMYEAARVNGYTDEGAREQMEMITCLRKEECDGPCDDYSDEFRANFHVTGHPRCYTFVQQLKNGEKIIGLPHWREITEKFLACKKPSQRDSRRRRRRRGRRNEAEALVE